LRCAKPGTEIVAVETGECDRQRWPFMTPSFGSRLRMRGALARGVPEDRGSEHLGLEVFSVGVQQQAGDDLPVDEVGLQDLVDVFFGLVSVPNAFRVNDQHRA
jgi:hypothetical protein